MRGTINTIDLSRKCAALVANCHKAFSAVADVASEISQGATRCDELIRVRHTSKTKPR